jgi:hypothetical protein
MDDGPLKWTFACCSSYCANEDCTDKTEKYRTEGQRRRRRATMASTILVLAKQEGQHVGFRLLFPRFTVSLHQKQQRPISTVLLSSSSIITLNSAVAAACPNKIRHHHGGGGDDDHHPMSSSRRLQPSSAVARRDSKRTKLVLSWRFGRCVCWFFDKI